MNTDTIHKPETQEYFINMGPQHPSTHGVLRLILSLDGEIIKNVEISIAVTLAFSINNIVAIVIDAANSLINLFKFSKYA